MASATPSATATPVPSATANATISPGYALGDSNCDGVVSAADAADLLTRITSPHTPLCGADANGDLVVDFNDLPALIEQLFDE